MDDIVEHRKLSIIEEARIEAKLVPNRRGQLYDLLADEIERLRWQNDNQKLMIDQAAVIDKLRAQPRRKLSDDERMILLSFCEAWDDAHPDHKPVYFTHIVTYVQSLLPAEPNAVAAAARELIAARDAWTPEPIGPYGATTFTVEFPSRIDKAWEALRRALGESMPMVAPLWSN